MYGLQIKPIFGFFSLFSFKSLVSSLFEIQLILFLLWPISTPFMNFISLMTDFNFILVLVPKFPGSLNLSFHNLSIYQFSRKNPSLAQFIPRIYNKIITKILRYFWGVTCGLKTIMLSDVESFLAWYVTSQIIP